MRRIPIVLFLLVLPCVAWLGLRTIRPLALDVALLNAADSRDEVRLWDLVRSGADPNASGPMGGFGGPLGGWHEVWRRFRGGSQTGEMSALAAACNRIDWRCVSILLAAGATPHSQNAEALCIAARRGSVSCCLLLLGAGADVNETSSLWGEPPIVAAAGSARITKLLLAAGADPNGRSDSGETALMGASVLGRLDQVRHLIAAGARVGTRDRGGRTALHCAALNEPVLRSLIEAGADLNARDTRGRTPLMFAVRGSPAAVQVLLRAGARPDARDNQGMTALQYARRSRYTPRENVRLLVDALKGHRSEP